jgi:flagellar motor protein MotB
MDYKELKEKADNAKEASQARAKENYHYARSLGFNSVESTLLQFKSKEDIDRIAKERDAEGKE